MRLCSFFTSTLLVGLLSGCGAGRAPVAPGEIPPGVYVSAEDEQYGQQVLAALMQSYPLSRDDNAINRVRDIVDKLAEAAGANKSPWNVYVLSGDRVVNAAATRGNFVFVWTGMFNVARTDGELAGVLAHEMGHVLANHTQPTPAEEASEITASIGGTVARQVVSVQGPYGALGGLAGILAEQAIKAFIVNPESQRKEFEADQIGMFLMADAGYDPHDAISLWTAMNSRSEGAGIPTFLSSHPANDERLTELEALLPEAMERYRVAKSFKPRSKRERAPQFEPDSFSMGKVAEARDEPSWRAIEDGTTIFSSPNTRSRPLARLGRDESLTVGHKTGEWYEVTGPVKGFVLAPEIYRGSGGKPTP
jgi:predicted Zn-dependent protease